MARKIAYSSMLVALSLIFSYVEAILPFSFGMPGIKLGLANLVVLTGLYFFPPVQVFVILTVRIVLAAFMFGNMTSLMYSLAGGIAGFFVMLLIKRLKGFSITGVSIAGGVTHNLGQLVVAALVLQSLSIVYYLPFLLIGGAVSGMLIGIVGQRIKHYLNHYNI